jgi:hypothetical protein
MYTFGYLEEINLQNTGNNAKVLCYTKAKEIYS